MPSTPDGSRTTAADVLTILGVAEGWARAATGWLSLSKPVNGP